MRDKRKATNGDLEAEMRAFLSEWVRSILARDVTSASALRADDYRSHYPDNRIRLKADELSALADPSIEIPAFSCELVEAAGGGRRARIGFRMTTGFADGIEDRLSCRMELVRSGSGAWRARRLEARRAYEEAAADPLPTRLKGRLRRMLGSGVGRRKAGFPDFAYLPYRSGEDYVLPRSAPRAGGGTPAELPEPPVELWLGYNYPAHGAEHVRTMTELVAASGFALGEGGRILDLGCGAGRMIRHLAPLAQDCEIWGADISAEHIFWCQRNLSPPFHFVTTTRVPHLPFADASFRFIYCGSLFTHIDDLADAWLLELRRLLEPGGRLYVTIHDEDTIAQMDAMERPPTIVRGIRSAPLYRAAKGDFDMFTIGRDSDSQVFHAREHFVRRAAPAFDLLSATPNAYFYQTALLFAPR